MTSKSTTTQKTAPTNVGGRTTSQRSSRRGSSAKKRTSRQHPVISPRVHADGYDGRVVEQDSAQATEHTVSSGWIAGRRRQWAVWRQRVSRRRRAFLARRPHRSFRLTRRREYRRSLRLPGYVSLTMQTWRMLWRNKRLFLGLTVLSSLCGLALSSVMSQELYMQLSSTVQELRDDGLIGQVGGTLSIFWGVVTSQLTGNTAAAGSSQQVVGLIIGLFTWLSTVWLARAVLLHKQPKLRDGLYSSGGPILALLVLVFVVLLQLVPAALALIAYSAADTSGVLDQTVMLMLAGGAAVLITMASVYWVVSTLFAMVIVTLPGMYPFQALRLAGDLVLGRRVRIVLRISWLAVVLLVEWLVVLVPVILLDGAIRSSLPALSWLPLVPLAALLVASFSVVFSALYVYLFYRNVVDDDAAPA